MVAPNNIIPGKYRHYKGLDYQVFGVARHSETQEWLVSYRCLYGDFSFWVRPFDMFTGSVTVNDQKLPRFTYIGTVSASDLINLPESDAGVLL